MRRTTRLLATAVLSATAAAGLVLPGTTASAAPARIDSVRLNGFEARLLADINRTRRAHGLAALTVVPGATDVARRWAWHLAQAQALSHNPHIVSDIAHAGSAAWTEIAENVGLGPSTDPDRLFTAYMRSPEHRANILDRSARYVGVGTVERGGVAYNTLDFTNAYSARYGATRVPAAGLTMDATVIRRTTDLATLDNGADQLFTSHGHGSLAATPVGFTASGGGNGGAAATFSNRARGTGHAALLMRDAMDLRHTSHLCLQLAAGSARGRSVPVQVVLRRSFGPSTVLGTVRAGHRVRWIDLPLPRSARGFRNTLVLRVGGKAVRAAGGRLRLAVYDVRAAV